MKVEWLGDDLKLLGKLPKEVADAFAKAERPAVIVGAGALGGGRRLARRWRWSVRSNLITRRLERLQRRSTLGARAWRR